jgi:N-acetylglucosamine kinase-like BadF-type ATPase
VPYYLGIDGGGSKTSCAVGDKSSVLATAMAGPSNIVRVGESRARESLHQAINQACAAAKIDPGEVQRVCVGAAGAGREEIASAVRRIVAELIPTKIEIVGDMEIALEAAFGDGPGVIVIAGTGSIAYGRDGQGRTARAGGWGYAISDEGSAHWIGRAAVASLLRVRDGGSEAAAENNKDAAAGVSLFRELSAAWRLHTLDELVRTANSNPDFAALFPAVLAAAEAGDGVGQRILARAAAELAQLAEVVIRRLFAGSTASAPAVPLAVAGGVFRYSATVRQAFHAELRRTHAHIDLNPEVVEPVRGALQMARKAAGQA